VVFAVSQVVMIVCAGLFCGPSITSPKTKPELEPQPA